eukprot:6197622-Pleurochrysis_carterae.AAC.7
MQAWAPISLMKWSLWGPQGAEDAESSADLSHEMESLGPAGRGSRETGREGTEHLERARWTHQEAGERKYAARSWEGTLS